MDRGSATRKLDKLKPLRLNSAGNWPQVWVCLGPPADATQCSAKAMSEYFRKLIKWLDGGRLGMRMLVRT